MTKNSLRKEKVRPSTTVAANWEATIYRLQPLDQVYKGSNSEIRDTYLISFHYVRENETSDLLS